MWNTVYEGIQIMENAGLAKQQANLVKEKIKYYAYEVATGRMSAEAAAERAAAATQDVANKKEYWSGLLDIGNEKITQGWWALGINAGMQLIDTLSDLIPSKRMNKIFDLILSGNKTQEGLLKDKLKTDIS